MKRVQVVRLQESISWGRTVWEGCYRQALFYHQHTDIKYFTCHKNLVRAMEKRGLVEIVSNNIFKVVSRETSPESD